jgi:Xaa-Pro aminopeptidase
MDRRKFIKTASVAGITTTVATSPSVNADLSRAEYRADNTRLSDDIAGDLKFSKSEYERRYKGIRVAMAQEDIDALVITGNRDWVQGELCNLQYVGIELPDWEVMYVIIPKDGNAIIPSKRGGITPGFGDSGEVVDFDYSDSAVRPGSRNSAWHAPGIISALKKAGATRGKIGLVGANILASDIYMELEKEFPSASFVDARMLMLNMRWYKSEEEIKFLRRSGYIADKGVDAMIDAAHVGAHDLDVWYAIDKACAKAGAPTGGFQLYESGTWDNRRPNIIFNPGAAKILEKGDIIIPEVGSNYKGYFTQLTVPVSLGTPPDEFYKAKELCDKVYSHMMDQFRPGNTVRGLDTYGSEYTLDISNGDYTLAFAFQCGEQERSFYHDDYQIQPGVLGYNQPFFLSTKGEKPWHVFGDAVVCTNGEPLRLHQSKMDVVIV